MSSSRKERVAHNQAVLRDANERLRAWPENRDRSEDETLVFLCECPNPRCDRELRLTAEDYEAVRADARRFAVTAGHEDADAEQVVSSGDGYVVVQKDDDVREIVERTNPRAR